MHLAADPLGDLTVHVPPNSLAGFQGRGERSMKRKWDEGKV